MIEYIDREKLSFEQAKYLLQQSRGACVDMLDLARDTLVISPRERDIMYRRLIDWNSLEQTGKLFNVTRERIRQIEAKVDEKMKRLKK